MNILSLPLINCVWKKEYYLL